MKINKEELMYYLKTEFPESMRFAFTRELISNVIDYAETHCNNLDDAHEMLVNIIPEVTLEEIESFMNGVG